MSTSEITDYSGPQQRIRELVETVIVDTPLFIIDVVVRGRPGSQVVDVYLECDDALDVERLAKVSREVGSRMEAGEVLSGAYQLNVSSPGVDRPIVLPRHFRKNIGRILMVKVRKDETTTNYTGELTGVRENGIEVKDGKGQVVFIAFDDIHTAKVQLPW